MAVDLVVFILPRGATALAAVFGDGDLAVFVGLGAVVALHQLGVAGRFAPVALNAGARGAQLHGVEVVGGINEFGHGAIVAL